MEPDYRLLRAFVAVAEEGHFGEAAVRLRIAQPALSKQIAKLEATVGGRLFHRTSRSVDLTPAGRVLLPEARAALEQARTALRRAHDRIHGHGGTLRVGFLAAAIRPAVLRAFEARFPDSAVELKRYEWFDQTACLRDGRADIAFVCPPIEEDGVVVEVLEEDPRMAVLPGDHPLAGRRRLSITDLAGEPVVGYHDASPEWRRFSVVEPRPDGSAVVYGPSVDTVEEKLEHVAAGHGIGLVPATIHSHYDRADLAFVPLSDVAPCQAALAWPAHEPAPLATELVSVAREER